MERSSIFASLPLTLEGVGVGGALRIRDAAHGKGIKWPRTSLEEYKEECPIVCPQSRIAQDISKTLECSCQHGKYWQEGSDSNKFGRGGNLLRHVDGRSRICFSAIPPSRTRCVARAHSSGQSDGQITEWSVLPFTPMPTNRVTQFEAEQFRVLLLRRLRLPLPLSVRSCRCGRLWLRSAGKAVHECPPT